MEITTSYFSIAGGCGAIFTADTGQFASPNYPKEYPNNKECVTTISVNPNKVVKLNFHRSVEKSEGFSWTGAVSQVVRHT